MTIPLLHINLQYSANSVTFSVPDNSVDMNSRSPVLLLMRLRMKRMLGGRSKKRGKHIFCFSPGFSPTCRVAGMTADLPSPHRPVRLLAPALSPVLFMSRWHASFQLVFGHTLFIFLDVSNSIVCVLRLSSSHARTSSIASLWSF